MRNFPNLHSTIVGIISTLPFPQPAFYSLACNLYLMERLEKGK
ncbi:hypothetical protein PARMER_02581 [Parabacteroides merdae ATCC 43184]|nr:hypothetical protein PARMER_02581 [Parabacteroides merdae ATCC 43184]